MNRVKIGYFFRSAFHYLSEVRCTHCGKKNVLKIDQKYFVTRLFKCQNCFLQFRHPVDSKKFSNFFYQDDYTQKDGITTDIPSAAELKALLDSNFSDSHKNVRDFATIFKTLLNRMNAKIVDYGCSWGYMSYQFKKIGFDVQSFEISRPRAFYGNNNLGLNIQTVPGKLKPGNDIFFSSHVIEHVPSISEMLAIGKSLITETGFFIAECPNGSEAFRRKNPSGFSQVWGLVHPSYLSEAFYQHVFKDNPYIILSSPYNLKQINEWDQKSQVSGEMRGDQLLLITRPNMKLE